MEALFSAFGIDWRLLVINLINFGVLLAVLWYFLYTPLTTMLESRREKLAQGVRDADDAKRRLEEIESTKADLLARAGKEADDVISQARSVGARKQQELVEAGEASAAALLEEADAQAQELKREAIEQSKQEVAKLIVLGIERTAAKKS